MQLIDLRNEVMNHGFDPVQFGLSRINQYLNDAQGLVVRRVDYYIDEATLDFTTVAGTAVYPQPTDFARDRSLRDTSRQAELSSASLRQIDRSVNATGAPAWYATDAANLHLYPTPDNPYPLELRYWKLPAPLVNDTDTPTIPADYHRMLWYWACKECYAGEDDSEKAQYWEQQFNTVLAEFAADVKFPSADRPNQVAGMWDQDRGLSRGWSIYGSTWGY